MVSHDRLHDRQAKARTVLLGRVVRREQTLAFLRRQPFTGIGYAQLDVLAPWLGGDRQGSTAGHGVHRVEHEI